MSIELRITGDVAVGPGGQIRFRAASGVVTRNVGAKVIAAIKRNEKPVPIRPIHKKTTTLQGQIAALRDRNTQYFIFRGKCVQVLSAPGLNMEEVTLEV